jgi:hypothetical protein
VSGTREAQKRAAGFVAAHGEALARARARVLRGEAGSEAALPLVPMPDVRDPRELRGVLSICQELRALRSSLAERTCAAVTSIQCEDGGFGTDEPLEARLRLTGALGGDLARSPYARPETLDAAGSFLADHFSPDLLQDFQWENVAAYAHFFSNALHDASDEILQWCGRELERGFRSRRFDALCTADVLLSCDAHALPGARLDPEELLLSLLGEQAEDGSFGRAPSASERVEPTLHGLRALPFLERSTSARRQGAPSC